MIIKYSNSPEEDYENTAGDNNNAVAMSNTDYPIFRLADTYLMLAECQLRGVDCDGLKYLNMAATSSVSDAISATTTCGRGKTASTKVPPSPSTAHSSPSPPSMWLPWARIPDTNSVTFLTSQQV